MLIAINKIQSKKNGTTLLEKKGKIDFDKPSIASLSEEYENVEILSVPSNTFRLKPSLVMLLPNSKSSKISSLIDSCPPIEK